MTKGIFENSMKTIKERNQHLNDKLDVEKLTEQVKIEMERGQCGEGHQQSTERYLEKLGTYLINSPDVETHRKVEDSFYLNEKNYKMHNKIGYNTIPDSVQVETELENRSEFNSSLDDGFIMNLFNPQNVSEDDLRRFIINWGNYTQIDNKVLRDEIEDLQNEIESVANANDFIMLNLFSYGLNVTETAKEMGITQPNVTKRVKNLAHRYLKQGMETL